MATPVPSSTTSVIVRPRSEQQAAQLLEQRPQTAFGLAYGLIDEHANLLKSQMDLVLRWCLLIGLAFEHPDQAAFKGRLEVGMCSTFGCYPILDARGEVMFGLGFDRGRFLGFGFGGLLCLCFSGSGFGFRWMMC
ncbi:hypothetical protein [Bradyrhizobium lablabi]|uniref:hypothetical protein n=1 Tax=Bradyrhizobium lablabi TaxID=722472 RepID=UPI001BA70CC6|nr:hypothetical protein [Bradyrhizobium lablabi]MBR0693664.1 hypothetical protein [Bradyrhizobium lablabi]